MVDRQQNKYGMYRTVKLVLNDNKTLWEDKPYFVKNVAALSEVIDAIHKAIINQCGDLTGYKIDKQNSRDELEESTLLVVNIMRSYAGFIKDNVLREQMHYTISRLKGLGGNDLIIETGTIHGIATEHQEGAAGFGLSQDFLDDLKAKNAAFLFQLNRPADAYRIKKEITAELKILFKEGDRILKESIDLDMLIFKKKYSEFYRTYFICRKIIGSHTVKLAMRIKIVDAVTKEAMPKSLVIIKDHDINRKSSPKGQIFVRNLKVGKHVVNVSIEGYKTQAVPATRVAGKTTMVVVEMVKKG